MENIIRIAFVTPNYPDETRVSILPCHIGEIISKGINPIIESGFGKFLNISDEEYKYCGAVLRSRSECYSEDIIFNLKLTQPSDYDFLRFGQSIIGWTHPYGSGADFYRNISGPLGLTLIDIDSVTPRIFRPNQNPEDIEFFPRHMFWRNSYNAGIASIRLAMQHFALEPDPAKSVCVLGSGSVAQGAFCELSRLGFVPRMFYRKTLPIFDDLIDRFDIIVNGIEVDSPGIHIMDRSQLERCREDVCIVDAAADAGNAVWGTEFRPLNEPTGVTAGRRYLLVNNAPTIMTEQASQDISAVVARDILPNLLKHRHRIGF